MGSCDRPNANVEFAGKAMNIKLEILEVRASANVDDS
jgi:hypothetical protein